MELFDPRPKFTSYHADQEVYLKQLMDAGLIESGLHKKLGKSPVQIANQPIFDAYAKKELWSLIALDFLIDGHEDANALVLSNGLVETGDFVNLQRLWRSHLSDIDAQLKEIFDDLLIEAREVAKEQYAQQYPARDLNSRRSLEQIEFRARGLAEGNMWSEVGERVAASDSGIGRVVQSTDSMFSSGRSGTFMMTSNPELATVRGGPGALLDIIQSKGVRAEPAIVEAAEKASRSGAITGNIDGVFRVGGRVLIVAGLAADGYRIYQADDRIRETVIVGGGWAGATGAMATYNAVTGPSNAGGPCFWAGNLVGNIAVGIGGYYAGEQIAELVYDLAINPEPIEVPSE